MSEYMAARLSEDSADFIKMTIGVKSFMQSDVPYILKSKYDELSLENARLSENLAKLKAELEKVKHETAKKECTTYIPDFTSSAMVCMVCGKSQAFHPQL